MRIHPIRYILAFVVVLALMGSATTAMAGQSCCPKSKQTTVKCAPVQCKDNTKCDPSNCADKTKCDPSKCTDKTKCDPATCKTDNTKCCPGADTQKASTTDKTKTKAKVKDPGTI